MNVKPLTEYSAIQCEIIRETEAALHIAVEGSLDRHWIPISQTSYIGRRVNKGEYPDTLHVANWILAKRGLV